MNIQFNKPAVYWTEALPVGNGSLGAMVFGGIEKERIALNEDTLWSGYQRDWNNPKAKEVLPRIRELVTAGRYEEADALSKEMMGPYTQSYLPFGDLILVMEHGQLGLNYSRKLDLASGIVTVQYAIGDIVYTREVFASYPDQVLVIRLTSSEEGYINFRARLDSTLRFTSAVINDQYTIFGHAPEHISPNYLYDESPVRYGKDESSHSLRFHGRLAARHDGGTMEATSDGIRIRGATTATLVISGATSFDAGRGVNSKNRNPDCVTEAIIHAALQLQYSDIVQNHVKDHRKLFGRVQLHLGESMVPADLPTDKRITEYGSSDPGLVELLFQYGRYLMIASSRPGTQPANLQGIWNEETRAPWSSNYTLNINIEMNYWPVETCNLAELHEPLLHFISRLAENGKKTAEINYGAKGWVAHHNSDIWAQTAPVGGYGDGDPVWALWPMGGVWLTQHLWEHYTFNKDEVFLRDTAYPIMKEAALFCLEWLVPNNEGFLVTSPSTSPEQKFVLNGKRHAVSQAATMDISLICELFEQCIESADRLQMDHEFATRLRETKSKLLPLQIGCEGQLQEWSQDFEGEDVHHRHVSHLVGVYPGKAITLNSAPELFEAAKKSLEIRGDGGTGWSLGWKIGLWARFKDGNRAERLISNLLKLVRCDEPINHDGGGVYANLFDAHPPFQIDGNFAATAGIAELLLQSHQGYLEVLPALPTTWGTGYVSGLRARGGYEVDIEWAESRLTKAVIQASIHQPCEVKADCKVRITQSDQVIEYESLNNGCVRFIVERGHSYVIEAVH